MWSSVIVSQFGLKKKTAFRSCKVSSGPKKKTLYSSIHTPADSLESADATLVLVLCRISTSADLQPADTLALVLDPPRAGLRADVTPSAHAKTGWRNHSDGKEGEKLEIL